MYKLEISKDIVSQYDYKTVKIAGFKKLRELGLPDNYFGGRVHRIVMLKDETNLLIIDDMHKVIGVMIPEVVDHISDTGKMVDTIGGEIVENLIKEIEEATEEITKTMFKCEKCEKEFDTRAKLGVHKRFCKVGGE